MKLGNTGKLVKTGVLMATALALLVVAACSSSNTSSGANVPSAPSTRIRPVVLTASVVDANSLSLPMATVQSNWNNRFAVATPGGQEMFMAYVYKDVTYVRASICPPCGSQSFSLVGDTLVCDVCGTVFYAQTGAFKVGACNYPKAAVATTVTGGNIVMKNADLLSAYDKTRSRQ